MTTSNTKMLSFVLLPALLSLAAPAFADGMGSPWEAATSINTLQSRPLAYHSLRPLAYHGLAERHAALSSAALRSLRQPGLAGVGLVVAAILMEESLKSKCEPDASSQDEAVQGEGSQKPCKATTTSEQADGK